MVAAYLDASFRCVFLKLAFSCYFLSTFCRLALVQLFLRRPLFFSPPRSGVQRQTTRGQQRDKISVLHSWGICRKYFQTSKCSKLRKILWYCLFLLKNDAFWKWQNIVFILNKVNNPRLQSHMWLFGQNKIKGFWVLKIKCKVTQTLFSSFTNYTMKVSLHEVLPQFSNMPSNLRSLLKSGWNILTDFWAPFNTDIKHN